MSNKSKARAGGAFGGKKSGLKTQRRWVTARMVESRSDPRNEPWSKRIIEKPLKIGLDQVMKGDGRGFIA